ncbi:MAG: hypothetical protein Q7S96_01500 [bacterium]|nr:hypothetical protein [bacterium]
MHLVIGGDLEVKEVRLTLFERLTCWKEIRPHTTCRFCHYCVDPERDDPWSASPSDYRMTCPECSGRFEAELEVRRTGGNGSYALIRYPYLSFPQVLSAVLAIREGRTPHSMPGVRLLHDYRPKVFWSAAYHRKDVRSAIAAAWEVLREAAH